MLPKQPDNLPMNHARPTTQCKNLERASTFLGIDPVPEAFMVLLTASAAPTRLSLKRRIAHIPSHSRLSIVVVVLDLPDNMAEGADGRPTTVRVTAYTAETSGQVSTASARVRVRSAAISAVVVAGAVGCDCYGSLCAAEVRRVALLEDGAVDGLALGVDVHQDFAVEFLSAVAAVEVVEGEATAVAA